jgi:flagellar hook-basal body complex protein FliE
MNPIQATSLPLTPPSSLPQATQAAKGQPSFTDLLVKSLDQVNQMQQDANVAVEQLFAGGEANTAQVLTAVQKADLSFKLMMQVRNKLVQAYEEIKDIRI